jgi:hypothetical protein
MQQMVDKIWLEEVSGCINNLKMPYLDIGNERWWIIFLKEKKNSIYGFWWALNIAYSNSLARIY